MPKKSDRPQHESAMSNLLPEVALDDEESDEEKQEPDDSESNSSTELQNSSDTEGKSYSDSDSEAENSKSESPTQSEFSSPASRDTQSHKDDEERSGNPKKKGKPNLPVLPSGRPSLDKKLGPYVSKEIDDALEEAYLTLRRQFGGEASKSLIVEAALRYTLSDCLRRGEESEIAAWMEKVLQTESS